MKRTRDNNTEAEHPLLTCLVNDTFLTEIRKNLSLLDLFVMTRISSEMRIFFKEKLASLPKLTLSYPKECSPCGHQYSGHDCAKPSALQAPCLSGKNVVFLDDIGYCRPFSLSIKSVSLLDVGDVSKLMLLEIELVSPVLRDTSGIPEFRPWEKKYYVHVSPRFEAYHIICLRRAIDNEETTVYYGRYDGNNRVLYRGKINLS